MKKFSKKKPICFEIEGTVYELPGELPVNAALQIHQMTHNRDADNELNASDVLELYACLLTRPIAEALMNSVGQHTLEEVIQWYYGELADKKAEKK